MLTKYLILAGYFLVLFLIGIFSARRIKDLKDYYVGGKKLGFWVVAFSTRATGESAWLLLGLTDGQPSGTVALRDLGAGRAEMKRMFVTPEAQGRGLGRALAVRLIEEARAIGYRSLRLDTGPLQNEAHDLYASLGFVPIPPYGDHETDMRDFLKFMELDLHGLESADPDLLRSA